MATKLTQLAVDKMRPDPARRIEVSDSLLPQLRLVVQPSGARSWAVRTRINGKTAKLTVGDARVLDLAKARAAARAKLTEIAEGKDPRAEKRRAKATTLGGVAELYLRDVAPEARPRTQVERERHLRRDWRPLHDRPLASISRGEIAARLIEMKEQHGPVAANRARATLHALFEWAIRGPLELPLQGNPVRMTKRVKERARERVLSLDELRRIWAAASGLGDYDAIVRLLMLSGQRRGEIAGMRWSELDLARRTWLIPGERTKNGKPHLVMLSTQMVDIIAIRPRQERDLVFGFGKGPFSGWSRSKQRFDRRCPIGEWDLHDLRRSFVTHLAEMGEPPAVIEASVNHASGTKGGIAGVYNRAEHLPERARLMQRWGDHLTGEPIDNVIELPARSALS